MYGQVDGVYSVLFSPSVMLFSKPVRHARV